MWLVDDEGRLWSRERSAYAAVGVLEGDEPAPEPGSWSDWHQSIPPPDLGPLVEAVSMPSMYQPDADPAAGPVAP